MQKPTYLNKYFVYKEGYLIAAQPKFTTALKYFTEGAKMLKGTPQNHTTNLTKICNKLKFIPCK